MADGGFTAELVASIGPVARQLLGDPNMDLSDDDVLRFGTNGSMAVNVGGEKRGTWYDHEAKEGGGVIALVQRCKRATKEDALTWLKQTGKVSDSGKKKPGRRPEGARIVATYPYTDEHGVLLFEVVRYEPKHFAQRQPHPDGGWKWDMRDVRIVPFRLPALLTAPADAFVYVVEGEKDALAMEAVGLVATCNPQGAEKWPKGFATFFASRHVVILPDNDEAGAKHAQKVVASIRSVAASVRVLDLPGLPPKGDVSDWLAQGGTAERLADLVGNQPEHVLAAPEAIAEDIELTEDGVALEFMKKHRDGLRFCHDTGKWFVWTGTHWQMNRDHIAFHWARNLTRKLNRTAEPKIKAITGKVGFAGGVEKFAQRDRCFAVTVKVWDCNNTLLGTPGGTVDLVTGQLRPSQQDDFITRTTAVAPAETADCQAWLAFLKQATAGDEGLVRFLQQWSGYCLTGSTREHALLFIYGPGGNGKSVFLNVLSGILGDYHQTAAMDTFTEAGGRQHLTFLAMMRGARMVTASETEEGRAWAESRIKQMTGGDPITANFMRQDPFTFTPNFKLTIAGNHKPALKNVDEAAKRRFNIVPFLHKPAQPDRQLEVKLKREWPGILRWMIEGCLDWKDAGLVRPKVVTDATDDYFEAQNVIGRWMGERCDLLPTAQVKPGQLANDCRQWAMENGETPPSTPQFRGAMEKVPGIRYAKIDGLQWVKGIALKPPSKKEESGGRGGECR